MKSIKVLSHFLLLSVAGIVSAINNTANAAADITIRPFISVIGGLGFAKVGQSQSSPNILYTTYSYTANSAYQAAPLFGIIAGKQFHFANAPQWTIQTGVLYQYLLPLTGTGISQAGYPPNALTNYSYTYHLQSQQLMAISKIAYALTSRFHSFLQIGVGAACNQTSDFQSTLTDSEQANATPIYANHININFAYQLGAGFDYMIMENWLLGLSYQFTNLGQANFGNGTLYAAGAPASTLNYAYHQQDVQVQQIVAQMTYLF